MTRPSATARNRRHHLLSRTALAGLGIAVSIGTTPALAQVTGVGTVASTASNGGAVGVASGGGVTDITLGASRSIVNWNNLGVASGDTLNFHFDNRGDIVLNRVTGSASIDGAVNGCVGTCGTTGGNVWILSSGGVMIGANARINTGGFLASTGGLTDADFLDGDMNFAFAGAPTDSTISVANGAQITAHGGTLALIAPIVNTAAGSTLTGANGGDVVYGSAENYNVTFAPTGADDLDLITFQVPSKADGSAGTPGLTLNGTTNANQVFAAVVSKNSVAASILLGGAITATAASGENGDIVLSASSGFTNGAADAPMGSDGTITQDTTSTLAADNVTMRASGAIVVDEVNATGQVWLDSAWAGISQTGAITASSLRAEAGAGIDLTDAGNDFDTISFLDNDGSGVVSLTDVDGFAITGGVNNWMTAGTVNLTALNGSITQSGGGVIWAGRLNASATGDIALGNLSNRLTTLGTLTAGGAVSYRGGTNFSQDGAVTAASLTLRSDTGAITQTGSPLNVGQLSVQAETGINLNRVGNQIDEITRLSTTSGDIILLSNGDLALAGNVTSGGVVSFQIFNGAITQNSGVITAATFSATADNGLDLDGENLVAQLDRLAVGGTGDITFRNAGALVLTGDIIAAGDSVNLYSTSGAITQNSGAITANRLTAGAAADIQLNTATNDVATIGGLASTSGSILYRDANSFDIQGNITTAATLDKGVVLRTVGAGATITQTSGAVDVGFFGANSNGSITINGANQIRRLVATTSSGSVSISTTTDLAIAQPITASQTLSLTSGGRIYEESNGYVVANTLNLSAVTGISLPNAGPIFVNSVQNLGTITNTTSGGVVIANYSGSNTGLTGDISAAGQSVSITDVAGGLNQAGGIITAGTLTASATGNIALYNSNAVASLGDLASSTGNVSFRNVGDVNLNGSVTSGAGGAVNLRSNTGAINLNGDPITSDWISLDAGTTISQAAGVTLTANALSLTAGGNVSLGEANNFNTIYDLNVAGDLTLRNLGTIDMNPTISGGYSSGGALTLISDTGNIRTTGAGVATSRLTASAAGFIDLNGTIASLGDITAGGNILLNTYNGAMNLTGDVTGQTVSLYADAGVAQSAGKIDANRLNVITNGAISLTGANEIDVVGRLSTDQLSSGTGADITLRNVGNIVLDYLVDAPGATVTFTSDTGAITQTSFSAITANRLIASAAGNITLYDGVNNVATIGGLASTNGDIVYRDADGFDIQGNITANSAITRGVMLVAGGAGAITQTSGVFDVGYFRGVTGGSITLGGANQIRRLISTVIGNGALSLNTTADLSVDGTVSASTVSLTSAGAITQANNAQIWTNTLNASAVTGVNLTASGFGANNIGNLGTISNTTSGGVTISNAMNFNLTGNVTASGQAVSISNTLGDINQTGGIITADTLSLSATGAISATRSNSINSLGSVASGGNFSFVNAGQLYLTGGIASAGQIVSLTANGGQIEQTAGGIITASTLNLTAAGRIWVNNANAVDSLGRVIAGGHVLFRNDGNTVVGDDITANSFDVTLRSNNGSITQTAGSDITSNSLQVIAQTGVTLTNAGNAINELAWAQNASGGVAFSQTNGFQMGGPILASGQTVSLTSLSGAITQNSGSLSAGTLNASAAGTLTLNQSNNVDSLGVISTGGSFLFRDVTGFDLTDNITAGSQVVMLAQGGSITQTGGVITANDINAMASVDLLLGGANQINAISALNAGGNLLYRQVGDLSVPTISAAGTISLYSTTGDITQTGTITADTLVLGAGDDITLGQNFVSQLGQIDAGGDFDASNAGGLSSGALALTGNITVGGAMTLVNPGAIIQTASTAITAGSLSIDTDGALGATGANSISGNTRLSATDAIFKAVGDLNLQVNTTGFATITSTGAVVFDGVGASTGDTLNVQAVNGISQGAAGLNFTNFGNLTNTTTGGINLTNSNWMTLNGAVSALDQDVTLNVASGGIVQSSGSNIAARRLSVTTTQGAILGEVNQVDELGVIDVGAHNFSFRTLGDLLIDGDITSALNVSLTSTTGGVSQTAGSDIKAGGLTVWAETGINLTNAGNDIDKLMTVINLGSGGVAYTQTDGFQIDGTVRALNQTVSLTSLAGGISETNNIFFPQIEAGTLNISAGGAITLHRDNDVDNLGVVSAVGGFTFNDVDGFNLTGALNGGGAVVLDARAGSISQTGGVVTASSLDAEATGGLDLDRANIVSGGVILEAGGDIVYRNAGSISVGGATAGGSVSLRSNTGGVTQTGAITGATLNIAAVTGISLSDLDNDIGALGNLTNTTSGQISFSSNDGFDLTGAITAGGSQFVSLIAISGEINQQAGGTITAQALSLSAWQGVTLGGDNDVDTLGVVVAGPSFIFNDIDGFDISAVLNAQTADLTAGGAITQSSGNLSVGTLSLKATSATLNGANDINNLRDVNVTGNFSLRDVDGIDLSGAIVAGGTLNLISDSEGVSQLAGSTVDVGRLEASAHWDVILTGSGNVIDALGDITATTGNISIASSSLISIDGDLSAATSGQFVAVRSVDNGVATTTAGSIIAGGNVTLRGEAGSVVLGAINAGGTLSVTAIGGAISSTTAPAIVANRFNAYAAQDIVLTGPNIDINQFGLISTGGAFSITGNNGPLDLNDNIFARTVALGTTGAITQSGGVITADTASISSGASNLSLGRANDVDTINLSGANVSFTNGGSFAANVITATNAVSLTSNTGKITQTASTGKIVADNLTASAATGLEFFGGQNDIRVLAGLASTSGGVTYRDMGGFEIVGDIDATGQTVELVSDGAGADGNDVVQTSGVITATRLQGTSAGDLLFNNANLVGQLGHLNAGGDIRYRGGASYTLQDNINAGGGLTLDSDTGSIQQFGGSVVAGAFSGTAAQGISLTRVNDVDALDAVNSGAGDFNFRDGDSFDIAGLIFSGNGVSLQAGGDITQSSGSVVTGALSLFANGLIGLDGPGNDIASLAAGSAGTDFRFADLSNFTLDGNVFAGGAMTLSAGAGNINQNAGVITAATLNASAADELNFTRANVVTTLGNLSADDRIFFSNADSFSVAGNLASDQIVLTSSDGGVNQTGGAITAGALAVDSNLGAALGQAGNDVDTLSYISVRGGDFTYRDADSLSISGPVSMSGVATFNVGGDLTQSGSGLVSASRVQGSAGGAFALGDLANNVGQLGPITADRIAFNSSSGLNLAGALTATNGVDLKAGAGITQSVGAVVTGTTLSAQADGDIVLGQDNDVDSIIQLKSQSGYITYADLDGFSLDPASYGDIWTLGTLTLKAGPTGGVSQTNAGLRAGTLLVSAGQDIVLGEQNQIDVLGASSAGGAVFTIVNNGDLAITGDVSVADALGVVSLTSTTGDIDQTAGRIDAYVVEGSAAGDYRLTRFTGAVGDITSTAGDIDIRNTGDITLRGLLKTGAANSVTLTSGGAIAHGIGRIEAGTLNLSAGTVIALDGAQGNDIDRLGTVSALSDFAYADDNGFDLTGDIDVSAAGGHVGLRSNGGAITQSGGVITVHDLNLDAATGLDLIGANLVDRVTLANGATGTASFTNAKALTVLDATSTGDVILKTTAGLLTSDDVTTNGLISLTGAGGVLSQGTLGTDGDVVVSASAGDIEVRDISAGDDVTVTANGGRAQIWNLALTGASDDEGTGQNVSISGSGAAFLGASDEAGIGLLYPTGLIRSGGAGTINVASTGGDAGVFLTSIGDKIDTLTAGGATGTATIVAGTGDILAGTVSGHSVVLKATSGDVNPDAVSIGGGDYTLTGQDFQSGAFSFTGAARDVLITDTAGALTLAGNVTAQRNLTVNAVGDILDGTGASALVAGADVTGQGVLTVNATSIAINTVGADGDVRLDAGTGLIDIGTLVVANDYTLSGGSFSAGALSPIGATAGTWTINDTDSFDFTGRMLTYNGDIEINAAQTITGGSAQSIFGSLRIDTASDIDVEGLYAAHDITVTSNAALTVGSATAYDGGISLTGGSATVEGFAEASGDVLVRATNGAADVGAATSGGDITVTATNGGAWLGSASLTGLSGDLTVSATGGDAILGAVDYASISTDNVLTRAALGAGTVTVTSNGGDARVYLDHADAFLTELRGDNVDVTVATGAATFGMLTALNGDAYVQTLDGGLNIASATAANGDVSLYALSGDAYVNSAEADGLLQVSALAGNATLRGARGGAGIVVAAALYATFGADSKSLINSSNLGITDPCGCGGIVVTSVSGNAVVNLDSVVGQFTAISAATGDVNVNLRTGDLTIGQLSGRNIAVEVANGSIETGAGGSPVGAQVTGGSYSITAQDFLGDVLNPLLEDEFGAPSTLQNYTIVDTLGDLDLTGRSIAAQGDIRIQVRNGALTGDVRLTSNGDVNVDALAGGVTVASVTAKDAISISASGGDAILGEGHLLGTGANQLLVNASGAGRNAILGSVLASGVTAANVFTSDGATTTAQVSSANGDAFVHLDTSDALTLVSGARDVGIVVRNGGLAVGAINAGADARVLGTDVTLANGLIGGALTIDAANAITFADGRIDVAGEASLIAGRGVTQASNAGLKAAGLTVNAGEAVSLGGGNDIAVIRAVDVATGGFAYNSVRVGGVDIVGAINAAGQTVDLRTVNGRLTQSGAGVIVAQRLTGSSDDGVNLRADNLIAELGDFTNTGGDFFLNVGQGLSIVGTVDSATAVTIQSNPMTIASTGTVRSTAAGDAVVLASNGVFTNQSGADAVQASNGRWLIYTQAVNDPSGSTTGDAYGGLSGKSYYGTSYDFDGGFDRQVNAGNRFVHAYQPVLTVTPVGGTMTYNGQIPTLTATILGLINGDTAADAWSGSAQITGANSKAVGTYNLGAALGSLLSDLNYGFVFGAGTLVIDPKTLTGTVNAQNKTYDGTTTANGAITLTGVIAGDDVSAAAAYGFGDKNAGTNKVVTASGAALSGDDASNYRLDPLATALADILRRDINAVVTANDKTYDATTAATGSLALDGVLTGDDLSITGDLLFADKNAGQSKVVSVANAQIGGADAGNYNVSIRTTFADIARKALTGTFVANDKTYDGLTAAAGALTINGVIVGDDATVNATYSFADKNAGLNKTVTANATLVGTDAGNYEVTSLGTATADILRKAVTVSIAVNNKTYDGTTAATGSMSLNGLIAGDDASVAAGSYSFADANAGTGKTVTIAGVALTGSSADNYELAGVPSTLLADILRRQVAISADDKTKLFGQLDPALTYRITTGSLVTGEGFTGDLARQTGEGFGDYAIGQGSLTLGANYEILFTPGTLSIRPVPSGGQDGSVAFKYLNVPQTFDLDWNPTLNFSYDREPVCLSTSDCTPG